MVPRFMELLFTDDFRLPNKFAGFVIKDTDSVDIMKSHESIFSRFLSRSLLPGFLGFLHVLPIVFNGSAYRFPHPNGP